MTKPEIIFFGNGPLANYALQVLEKNFSIIFHAHTKEDLEKVKEIKRLHLDAYGILASFGILIKPEVLKLFEPTGIVNIHPSLLPKYRGASPIESAILDGETNFSVSIMKLANEMDAGPIYYQTAIDGLPLEKDLIYKTLAETGANWISDNLLSLKNPTPQTGAPTYTKKLNKSMSPLEPNKKSASMLQREVIAFQSFPKSKHTFFNQECTILSSHTSSSLPETKQALLSLKCVDGNYLIVDELQPASKKPMDWQSFINGYVH